MLLFPCMERKFCYICGGELSDKKENSWSCKQCDQRYYENPRPCVEIILFDKQDQVLISKRGIEPRKGKYDIPGGFVDLNETLEEALAREIKEELDLEPGEYTQPKYCLSWHADYPWGKETAKTLMSVYTARLQSDNMPKAQDDVESVMFVSPNELDIIDFSHQEYKEILRRAVDSMSKE